MENLSLALPVVLNGLIVVFFVMSLIAGLTWGMGRIFIVLDARDQERQKAVQEKEEAERVLQQEEKARKKDAREGAKAALAQADDAGSLATAGANGQEGGNQS